MSEATPLPPSKQARLDAYLIKNFGHDPAALLEQARLYPIRQPLDHAAYQRDLKARVANITLLIRNVQAKFPREMHPGELTWIFRKIIAIVPNPDLNKVTVLWYVGTGTGRAPSTQSADFPLALLSASTQEITAWARQIIWDKRNREQKEQIKTAYDQARTARNALRHLKGQVTAAKNKLAAAQALAEREETLSQALAEREETLSQRTARKTARRDQRQSPQSNPS